MTELELIGKDVSRRRILRMIFGVSFVMIAVMIFAFSAQSAHESSETSGPFSDFLFSVYKAVFGEVDAAEFESVRSTMTFIVRKAAHFTVYALLGASASLFALTFAHKIRLPLAYLSCVLYALSDELHQSFVPGRAMRLFDVFIDSLGALTGLVLVVFALNLMISRRNRRKI